MKELEGQTRTLQLLSPPIKKPSRYVFACQGRITLKFPPLYGVFIRYEYHMTCLPCKNDGMWSTSTLKPLGGSGQGGSINSVWVIRAFLWFINSCSYLQPFLPVIGGSPDANMWYTRLPQASFSPEMTRKTNRRSIEGSMMLRTSIERPSRDQSILKL